MFCGEECVIVSCHVNCGGANGDVREGIKQKWGPVSFLIDCRNEAVILTCNCVNRRDCTRHSVSPKVAPSRTVCGSAAFFPLLGTLDAHRPVLLYGMSLLHNH